MLTTFRQGPNASLSMSEDYDFPAVLRQLWTIRPRWPEREAVEAFATRTLSVRQAEFDKWYRLAWWGYYAARMLDYCAVTGRTDKVVALLERPAPWAILDKALSAGKGAILLTAHLGPGYVPAYAAKQNGYCIKSIAIGKGRSRTHDADDYIFVASEAERKVSLIKAMKHLRGGGLIAASPTGQFGNTHVNVKFFGQQFPAYLGIAELARLSGAPIFWASATWSTIGQLRLVLEPVSVPDGDEEGWTRRLLELYFRKLADQMIHNPADLGFRYGYWDFINWYTPQSGPSQPSQDPLVKA